MVKFKKLGWIFLFTFVLLTFTSQGDVLAQNKIESIHIEAHIQENGSVIIRDHRIFYAEEGTEHYISLGNLGDSDLLAFTVYDENYTPLEDVGKWDINASFSQKAGKYGINYAGSEIELCFGLGEYGRREFTIEYEITNFISNLSDKYQRFYWQFINANMDPIDNIQIEVIADNSYEFVYPQSRFWAFGHEGGSTEIRPDALIMESGDYFDQSDYVVLMGIFEGSPFAASHQSNETSEELIEKAMYGAKLDGYDYEDYTGNKIPGQEGTYNGNINKPGYSNMGFNLFSVLLRFFVPITFIGIFFSGRKNKGRPTSGKFKPTATDNYYREVPYKGQFIKTQYFTNSEVSDWISAFILKWVSEGRLLDQVEEVGLIFKKDKLALKIQPGLQPNGSGTEKELWDMVVEAAGQDQILSEKEFNRYVSRKINSFNDWTDSIKEQSEESMIREGYLQELTEKVLKIFTRRVLSITQKGQILGDNILGFKNYLKDFSLLEERGVSHVALWQELMVWAAYMGIAQEVYEQLKIVNPNILYDMPYDARTIIMTNNFAHAVQSTQTSANTSSTSSSFSGGGGGSFSGGGGGSFGGGSGGGTR